MFIGFENDAASALSDDEPVAILVIGSRGLFRPVIEAGGQGAAGGESGDADAADRRFGAAGDHDFGVAKRDQARRIPDRMRAGRAGRDDRVIWAAQAVLYGDIAAGQIDQPAGNEKGRNAARPFLMQGHRGLGDAAEAADP